MKVKIMTDSNSGITQKEGKELGINVVPMPFIVNGEEYFEDISLTQEQFYELLKNPNANVSTSQPSSLYLAEQWDEILKEYDAVVYIPMSSGLTGAVQAALNLAAEEKYAGKVFVVDNQRISVTQKQSVYEAIHMAELGKTAQEIHDYLMDTKFISSIYIMVDTLKYLKKGGRVTPAAALLGSMLRIRPVLQIQGYKLDAFYKALNLKQAKMKMIATVKEEFLSGKFKEYYEQGRMKVFIAHTQNAEEAEKFRGEIEAAIPNVKVEYIDPLSLSVSCHIGPGALAIATAVANY